MKSLKKFSNETLVSEKEWSDKPINATPKQRKRIEDEQDLTQDDVEGKSAEENSKGVWAIDEPTDDDLLKETDDMLINRSANEDAVLDKMVAGNPFFIQGRAGWGKTSVITQIAKKLGRSVVTVYLDKAEAVDLGGIPTAQQDKNGVGYQTNLMPGWAKIMWENQKKKEYLLFFDEMNQATPDVMNALMPIVLKNTICGQDFDNFIVGAAGNFDDENEGGINELSKPLLSRFGGIIVWEAGDWDASFKFLHKKWDDLLSKKFIDMVESNATIFDNPRDLEKHIIEHIYGYKKHDEKLLAKGIKEDSKMLAKNMFTSTTHLKYLMRLMYEPWDKLERSKQDKLEKFAEFLNTFVKNGYKVEDVAAKRKKGRDMIPEDMVKIIRGAIKRGYIEYDVNEGDKVVKKKYAVSKENLMEFDWVDDESGNEALNAEMIQRLVDKFEADGDKFKYNTDEEWKKDNKRGLLDPKEA